MSATTQRRPAEQRLRRLIYSPVIRGRAISPRHAPYIVAEISGNHGGSLECAKRLIAAAKWADADAVKLQTYVPSDLTTPKHKALWALYEKHQTPREWHRELFDYANELGITIFSSAFSLDSVKFLQDLGAPAIKIASPEIDDGALLDAAHRTELPLIISTGCATREKLDLLPDNAILLHCVAEYPARIEDANLRAITTLREDYGDLVGLSDHTPGYETAIAATALGAVMIEKHLKLDEDCVDAVFSLDRDQFRAMCRGVRAIWHGMGDGVIRPTGQPRQR